MKYLVRAIALIPTRQHRFLKCSRQAILKIAKPNRVINKVHHSSWFCVKMTAKRNVLLIIMIKIFKDVDDTIVVSGSFFH